LAIITPDYYAHECPIIPELIPIKIATYYSQNYAGILGSSLVTVAERNCVTQIATFK